MRPRILVVDDEPELLKALCIRLTAEGFACERATNGQEALTWLKTNVPDLIILDLLMPDMNGYEVRRRLQDDPRTAQIPVIVLTAVPERTVKQTTQGLGASSVLHKPFDTATLLSTVRHFLKLPSLGGSRNG
jgi:DNA-binding response OmpR family regulator